MTGSIDFNNYSEEDFIKFALDSLKYEIKNQREQEILGKTRLIKFIVLIAEEVGYTNLTYGWYRNGYYCPSIYDILLQKNINNLSSYVCEHVKSNDKQRKIVNNAIAKYKDIFLRDAERFFDWVYRVKSPKQYRKFYSNYYKFTNDLKILSQILTKGQVNENHLAKIENDITNYYEGLTHVDEDTFSVFCDFTDILEAMNISLRYNKNKQKISNVFDELISIHNRLYTFLTPYTQTLVGPKKEIVIENFIKDRNMEISGISNELKKLEIDLRKQSLWPSHEEMIEYTKKLSAEFKPQEIKEIEKALLS